MSQKTGTLRAKLCVALDDYERASWAWNTQRRAPLDDAAYAARDASISRRQAAQRAFDTLLHAIDTQE